MTPTERFGAPQGPGQAGGNAVTVALFLGTGVAAPLALAWYASSDDWARASGFARELFLLAVVIAGLGAIGSYAGGFPMLTAQNSVCV